MPNLDTNLIDAAAAPGRGTRTASYSRAVAERPDRHRLQRQADQGGHAASRSCSPAPTSRARSPCSPRCATRWASCSCSIGADPEKFTDDRVGQRHRRARKARRRRAGPGVHRQRVHPGPRRRATSSACEAWSGDVIQRAVRQPGHQVRRARGGPVAVERQHAGAQPGDPPGERRGVDRTTTTTPRSPRSSPPGSTTSARSRAPSRRWRRSTRRLVDNPLIFPTRRCCETTYGFMALDETQITELRRRLRRCHRWLTSTTAARSESDRPASATVLAGSASRSGVTKEFATFTAVDDLDLDVPRGSFFALLGPSGLRQDHDAADGRRASRQPDLGHRSTSATTTSPYAQALQAARSTRSSRATRCSRT